MERFAVPGVARDLDSLLLVSPPFMMPESAKYKIAPVCDWYSASDLPDFMSNDQRNKPNKPQIAQV